MITHLFDKHQYWKYGTTVDTISTSNVWSFWRIQSSVLISDLYFYFYFEWLRTDSGADKITFLIRQGLGALNCFSNWLLCFTTAIAVKKVVWGINWSLHMPDSRVLFQQREISLQSASAFTVCKQFNLDMLQKIIIMSLCLYFVKASSVKVVFFTVSTWHFQCPNNFYGAITFVL